MSRSEIVTKVQTSKGKVLLVKAWYHTTKELKYFAVWQHKRIEIDKERYLAGLELLRLQQQN